MIVLSGNISPAAGGVERTVTHLVRRLADRGREVAYLEVHPGTAPEGTEVVPVEVPWRHGVGALLNPFRLRRALRREIGALGGRVEQIWARNPVVPVEARRALPDVPLVFIPPGTAREMLPWERTMRRGGVSGLLKDLVWRVYMEPLARRTEASAVRAADRVVVFSENMAILLREAHGAALEAKLRVVPPGVDGSRFVLAAHRTDVPRVDLPEPRIAFLGRLVRRKGPQILLEALAELQGVGGVFVGEGRLREALEARAREPDLAGRVLFTGHVPDPERYLASCRVFALPSVSEPFGHVMLEALACGLPVVGFDRSSGARTAVEDVVEPGRTGVLVSETAPEALADGLRRALELARDPETAARCRARVLERHDWGSFVDRTLDLAASSREGQSG